MRKRWRAWFRPSYRRRTQNLRALQSQPQTEAKRFAPRHLPFWTLVLSGTCGTSYHSQRCAGRAHTAPPPLIDTSGSRRVCRSTEVVGSLFVQFRQFVNDDLGCASYLIGDESSGEAVVVDPAYAIEQYLAEAEKRHVRITRVLETHTHADHVSGHGRLALEHGATIFVHPAAEPEFDFEPLADGQEISLGDVVIRVLHTPGHRPNSSAPRPPNMDRIVALNRGPLLAAQPPLGTVDSAEGASVLDVRTAREFVAGHLPGSFNVPVSGSSFATKAAFVLTSDEPV